MNTRVEIAELKARSVELTEAAARIAAAVAEAEAAGLSSVYAHWQTLATIHVPAVVNFSAEIGGKVTRDVLALKAGRESKGKTESARWKHRRDNGGK